MPKGLLCPQVYGTTFRAIYFGKKGPEKLISSPKRFEIAGQIFLGVFLAGIALMLVYWLFTSFHWFTLLITVAVLWFSIHLLTKKRPSKEVKERQLKNEERLNAQIEREFKRELEKRKGFDGFYFKHKDEINWVSFSVIAFAIMFAIGSWYDAQY